jgi:DNA-binding response OmpR family regulator/two-component sensor histidine kinase
MTNQNPGVVLIVDDNPDNIEILEQTLRREGYEIRSASDGMIALEQVSEDLPNLILLDVMMPNLDGFETCSRLKAHEITRDIPVIFMTALSDTESKIRGLSLGAVDYITKPFSRGEVLARVKTQLSLQHLMQTINEKNSQLQKEIERRNYVESELRQFNEQLERGVLIRNAKLQQTTVNLLQKGKLAAFEEVASSVVRTTGTVMEGLIQGMELAQQSGQQSQAIVASMQESCDRLHAMHQSLSTLIPSSSAQNVEVNVHDLLDNVLVLLNHHFQAQSNRPKIEVVKLYDNAAMVMGLPDQLSQAFIELLMNAIDSFDDHCPDQPSVIIRTEQKNKALLIHIADNAGGIALDEQAHIFDYAYTTKHQKSRTGLGLPIVYQIFVDTHAGDLSFISTPGKGTEFTISLPLHSA